MTTLVHRRALLAAAAAAVAGHGQARTDARHLPAPEPPLAGARLAGQGMLRFLGLAVYRARLWVSPGFRAERFTELPFALELSYQRTLAGAAIADRSVEEIHRASPLGDDQATAWRQALRAALPDVAEGDRLTGLYRPGEALELLHTTATQHRSLGRVGDAEFARRFMGIWLAPTTSEPALRLALLGDFAPAR